MDKVSFAKPGLPLVLLASLGCSFNWAEQPNHPSNGVHVHIDLGLDHLEARAWQSSINCVIAQAV
jgi:hypothetical protein